MISLDTEAMRRTDMNVVEIGTMKERSYEKLKKFNVLTTYVVLFNKMSLIIVKNHFSPQIFSIT